jgi:nucleoside diphosphate kinase
MLIDARHGKILPGYLSDSRDKLDLYASDTYFLESWEDLRDVLGEDPSQTANRLASITLKPDAIAGRVLRSCLGWLEQNGFRLVTAELVNFGRHSIRLMWAYSWNVATRERKELVDELLTASPSLLLILIGSPDAARWLSLNKGPADPARREPGHLRYGLGTFSPLLNFIHTADEAADFIRELAIFADSTRRREIYEAASHPDQNFALAYRLVSDLEDSYPFHSLDFDHAVASVKSSLSRQCNLSNREHRALARWLEGNIRTDGYAVWREALETMRRGQVPVAEWDALVIGTYLVAMDDPQGDPLVPSISSRSAAVLDRQPTLP